MLDKVWEEIFAIEEQIKTSTSFEEKLELKDRILEIKKQNGLIKPDNSTYECEGCSA